MVIFTKKFGTLYLHLPIVWDKVPKKTAFFTPSLNGISKKIANINLGQSSGSWGRVDL